MYFLDNLLCGRPSWKPPKPPRSPVATTNGTMAISLSPHRPLSRHHTTTVDIGWKANIDYKAKLNLNKVFCKSSVVSRLQNLDDRSGEFCVCKLIVFTCEGQIGAIHTQIITKPVVSPSTLSYLLVKVAFSSYKEWPCLQHLLHCIAKKMRWR